MPDLHRSIRVFAVVVAGSLMLIAPAAQACQLVCMVTKKPYQGDYMTSGGKTADQKCDEEYKGFKFARSRSILANLPHPPASAGAASNPVIVGYGQDPMTGANKYVTQSIPTEGNVNSGIDFEVVPRLSAGNTDLLLSGAWVDAPWGQNCNNGTSSDYTTAGSLSDGSTVALNCNNSRPLLCCNM